MGSLRDAILSARELPRQEVATPEWAPSGVPTVHVRGFTVAEAEMYRKMSESDDTDAATFIASLCARVVVDDAGEQVFTDDDTEALKELSSTAVNRVVNMALQLAANGPEETNPSKGDRTGSSSTGSPSRVASRTRTT